MTTKDILHIIEDLREEDMAMILFGKHLTVRGREQVATILEKNIDEYCSNDYSDIFDCISSAAETFKHLNGHYPESEEDILTVISQ